MEVNKLESREVMFMLFGLPIMMTLIVLASIGVGHAVTTRSSVPTPVNVSAAAPRIDVNVPQAAAPRIEVSAPGPKIDVNVPAAQPIINVATPQPLVTVLHEQPKPQPAPSPSVQAAPVPQAIPVAAPIPEKKTSSLEFKEEDLNLDTLYKHAEAYVDAHCKKLGLDPATENKKWQTAWRSKLEQSTKDGTDTDEQSFINRAVIAKRDCFDVANASPEKIVEACRIMLRYRDANLSWLRQLREAATGENLKKTLVVLAAGSK